MKLKAFLSYYGTAFLLGLFNDAITTYLHLLPSLRLPEAFMLLYPSRPGM